MVNELQTALGSLQEAGEEAEMMATNLSDHINHDEQIEIKQSPLLYNDDSYPDSQEDRDVDEFNQEYQEESLDYENEDPYSDGEESKHPKFTCFLY